MPKKHSSNDTSKPWVAISLYIQQPHIPSSKKVQPSSDSGGAFIFSCQFTWKLSSPDMSFSRDPMPSFKNGLEILTISQRSLSTKYSSKSLECYHLRKRRSRRKSRAHCCWDFTWNDSHVCGWQWHSR